METGFLNAVLEAGLINENPVVLHRQIETQYGLLNGLSILKPLQHTST